MMKTHEKESRRRVVVTGMGAVTALGIDVASTWEAILAGKSGVRQIRQFPSDDFPVRIGSEVDVHLLGSNGFSEALQPYVTRSIRMGASALQEAWQDSGLKEADFDPWRAGLAVGGSNFPVIEQEDYTWTTDA